MGGTSNFRLLLLLDDDDLDVESRMLCLAIHDGAGLTVRLPTRHIFLVYLSRVLATTMCFMKEQ